MEISSEEYKVLDKIRHDKISALASDIMTFLRKYYTKGTKVIITGDCWHIEKNEK